VGAHFGHPNFTRTGSNFSTSQADLRIADEQRRAEARKALRELEYDNGKDGDDMGEKGPKAAGDEEDDGPDEEDNRP
jgi:hypothetical protein